MLGRDPEEVLQDLRKEFVKATSSRHVAVHTPVPGRRKHQILADNRPLRRNASLGVSVTDRPDTMVMRMQAGT